MRKLEHEAGESRADAALLVAFQHEIRTLKRDIGEAEEEGLGLVSDIERLTAEREGLRAAVAELDKEFAQYATNVDKESRETIDRAHLLEKQRKQRGSSELAPDVLGMYEKLLASREGQAMAWESLPVRSRPVLPGTVPVLRWFAAERRHAGPTHSD